MSGLLGGHSYGVKSRVLCHSSSVLLLLFLKAKVARSLTDVWQQLFEQQDITIICTIKTLATWKSHQCNSDTDWNRHAGTCLLETSEEQSHWRAEMAFDRNVVSNQQSFIDQASDKWRDCFNACRKAKSKHFEYLLSCYMLCFSVNVMTFEACVTAIKNKLTHVLFHKVGWEQLWGQVGNFDAVLLQIYLSICVPKISYIRCGVTKLLQK